MESVMGVFCCLLGLKSLKILVRFQHSPIFDTVALMILQIYVCLCPVSALTLVT